MPTDNGVPSAEGKAEYIRQLFEQIADDYDGLNQVISMGQWCKWHRELLRHIAFQPGDRILDVACGTGDLALLSADRVSPGGRVIGIDFSERMLEVGRRRVAQSPHADAVTLQYGDTMELRFSDESFDGVTMGWAMRNVASIPQALAEIYRVLKPGGRFVCMDAAKPYSAIIRFAFFLYWKTFLPCIDRFWIRGAPEGRIRPYTYLSRSLDRYLMPHELELLFQAAGFRHTEYRLHMLGTVAIHVGIK